MTCDIQTGLQFLCWQPCVWDPPLKPCPPLLFTPFASWNFVAQHYLFSSSESHADVCIRCIKVLSVSPLRKGLSSASGWTVDFWWARRENGLSLLVRNLAFDWWIFWKPHGSANHHANSFPTQKTDKSSQKTFGVVTVSLKDSTF